MKTESLATALEREHQEIDAQIGAFTAGPPAADQGRRSLARAVHALRRHIYLEEEFLFPLLCKADPGLTAPVFVLLREHAQVWATLESVERELGAGTGPSHSLCRQLTVQLLHHNLKEEKTLYPRADDLLATAAAERLRAFLDCGDFPGGWVCMRARPTATAH